MKISHEFKIDAMPETIIQAVSTEEGIKGWWSANCQVGTEIGSESTLQFDKQGMIVVMGFKTIQKDQKVVEWECISMPNPAWIGTKVRTEVVTLDKGCNVLFTHDGFDEKWVGQEPFEQTKATWNHFMNSLKSYCEAGEGQPW